MIEPGELIQLQKTRGKNYIRCVPETDSIKMADGRITAEQITNSHYGDFVYTHRGGEYRLVMATLSDLVKGVRRETQIIYPKDIGFILMKLRVFPGARVIDAGAGSGSLAAAFAWFVGQEGAVYCYERRADFCDLCRRNLEQFNLENRVEIREQDVEEGFEQNSVDAVFVDIRTPWTCLDAVQAGLKPGGLVGFLLPTTNQVSSLLEALRETSLDEPEVAEILLRHYKGNPERLRPDDRMVGHTGYLLFSRYHPEVVA